MSNTVTLICGTILAAVAIVTLGVLTWHGSITGQEFTTFISSLGLAGVVGTVAHVAVGAGAKAAAKAPEK